MATEGPKVSNGIVSNNPDFFTRADPDVNNKYRQVVRLDKGVGTAESIITDANPLPVTAAISGPVQIQDSTGASILSVPDSIWFTGASSPPLMGYDFSNNAWSPLPLNFGATAVPVELSSQAVTVAPTYATTAGTITTATSTVQLNGITGYGGVSILVRGTYNNVNFTPEVSSDGTNWSTVSMSRQDTPQIQQTSGALTNTTRAWIAPTLGAPYFRVRATTWTSGTMNVQLTPSMAAVPTAVTVIGSGTFTIAGTVTANPVLTTACGGLPYKYLDLNNTGQVIKASKAYVSDIYVYNDTGATIYVKVYNKATAATSADTPVQVYGVPTKVGLMTLGVQGIQLGTGCSVRCTTGVADADTTSPAANGCVFSCTYT